jgi:hypothetical protein
MTGGDFCNEYGNVRADVVNVTHALEHITEKLRREQALSDDGTHNPDWEVHVDHRVIERLLTFLGGVRGLLWHLGNEPRAAEALLIAHKGEAWAETFLRIAAANAAAEEAAPANE